jgi:hypothetical protein
VVACHAITLRNYHLMLCSVMINLIFNTVKPQSIVSEGTIGRLVVVMERDFISALRLMACCTIPG